MAARTYGYVTGALLLLLGIGGFLATGFERWLAADTDAYVLWFQLNPLHNGVHFLVGAALLWAAAERATVCRTIVALVGMAYVALGAAGFWLVVTPDANVLALNAADNVLHLAVGAGGLLAAAMPALPPARD